MTSPGKPRERKAFGTLAVCGVYTGRLLEEKGYANIAEVMDHFYPGIMTMGQAAMQPNAAAEVARQLPQVASLDFDSFPSFREYAVAALGKFGPSLELIGPLVLGPTEASQAFASLKVRP